MTKAASNYVTGTSRHSSHFVNAVDIVCDCYEWVRGVPLDGISKTCPDCGQEWAYKTVPVLLPRIVRTEKLQGALL